MPTINPTLPTIGGQRGDGEGYVRSALVAILNLLNGGLDLANFLSSGVLRPPLVTSLPGSPADADEIYYLAAAGPVLWHLRYRSAAGSAHKWEHLGGAHLETYQAGTGSIAGSASYVDASDGAGPTVTVPLAGDYRVEYGGRWSSALVWLGLSFAGGAPDPLFRLALNGQPTVFSQVFTGLTAGETIKLQYQQSGAVSSILDRFVRIIPVRIG